jgi:arylsulfatase A-like enzyme
MVSPDAPIRGVDINKAGQHYGTHYWIGPEIVVRENLEGDDSRVIMDRALSFIEGAASRGQPFFAVIWFHTPHTPVVAGPPYRELYSDLAEEEQHYFGCITAMDEQIGRLRASLKELGISRDTMLWFCSDNGPEGDGIEGRSRGSTGPFRGRKRSLLEGGVRVPAFLEWPAMVTERRVVDMPCVTSDYLPTILEVLGRRVETHPRPLDGRSLLPVLEGRIEERTDPIGFQSADQLSLVNNRYKLYSSDQGATFALYDLLNDPGETSSLESEQPEVFTRMRGELEDWLTSCRRSLEGADY